MNILGRCTTTVKTWLSSFPARAWSFKATASTAIFPPDRNNFAPRFGFAYQPTARNDLVVRGGFGVYYDQININPFLDYRPPNGAADGLEGNPAGPQPVSSYSASAAFSGSPASPLFPASPLA